jgi:hypothetical protein
MKWMSFYLEIKIYIIIHSSILFFHPETVGGAAWQYFSAVCWYYGIQLYEELRYPIGLVATTWGGTPVEAWSSPDALATCGINETAKIADNRK